jgi:hypothetical protein
MLPQALGSPIGILVGAAFRFRDDSVDQTEAQQVRRGEPERGCGLFGLARIAVDDGSAASGEITL